MTYSRHVNDATACVSVPKVWTALTKTVFVIPGGPIPAWLFCGKVISGVCVGFGPAILGKVKATHATEVSCGMYSACCSVLRYLVALLKPGLKINSVVMVRNTGLNSGTT